MPWLDRIRGWRLAAVSLAPIVWFQVALAATGIYAGYVAAQGGRPLEETPFFDPETGAARIGAVSSAGSQGPALLFYGLDIVNAALLAVAFAALIAFGLRRLRWTSGPARWLVAVPVALFLAELVENGALATALLAGGGRAALATAGAATGLKFVAFAVSAVLALLGLAGGLCAWAVRRGDVGRPDAA